MRYDPTYLRAIARQRAELDDAYALFALDRDAQVEYFTGRNEKIGELDRHMIGAARRYRARWGALTGDTLVA